ncbi:MAG: heparan-alpha-glucosaminide N-acetyltransferase domain-containing protein, partial [Nannocystaceae bacterium]
MTPAQPDTSSTSPRVLTFDLLRGIAVLLMMEQHLGVWLWRGPDIGKRVLDYPVLFGINILGGGAAPAFLMLAGVGATLFLARTSGSSLSIRRKVLVMRGLMILGFGYLLSLLTPSWFTLRSWYVLHLIGAAQVFSALLGRRPRVLALSCLFVLIATPIVQSLLSTPAHMTNIRMTGVDPARVSSGVLPGGHLRLALAEGQFPLLPWFAIFGWGALCGGIVDREEAPRWLARRGAVLATFGGLMVASYHLFKFPFALAAPRIFKLNIPFFPCTPAFILLIAGVLTMLMGLLLRQERRGQLNFIGALCSLGRCSLSVLIIHVVVFRELVRPLGLWQACDVATASAILIMTLISSLWLARRWHRSQFRFGAEWLLRKLAPTTAPPP